jgi:hypothetical protein
MTKVITIFHILIARRVINVEAVMQESSLVLPHFELLLTICTEGVGLGAENCKPLWDKVTGQGTGQKKSWNFGREIS